MTCIPIIRSILKPRTRLIINYVIVYYFDLKHNSFPMRDWHVNNMEQTLVRYVMGLSENATRWEKKVNKRYGTIGRVSKRVEYDIKHGVEKEEVYTFLQSLRTEPSFSEVRNHEGSLTRLNELQKYFNDSTRWKF